MSRIILYGLIAMLLFVTANTSIRNTGAQTTLQPQRQPRAIIVERKPTVVKERGVFEAIVVEITLSRLSMRLIYGDVPENRAGIAFTGSEPLHTIKLSDFLASGSGPKYYNSALPVDSSASYSRADLKQGDIIEYTSYMVDGIEECVLFKIVRRPRGLVPAAPQERPDFNFLHHVQMQALQNFEEKGLPIEEKWGGKQRERELTTRIQHVKSVLATAEKVEKAKEQKPEKK